MKDWKADLGDFFDKVSEENQQVEEEKRQNDLDAKGFIASIVVPALEEVKQLLEEHGREVTISRGFESAHIIVRFNGLVELDCEVIVAARAGSLFAHPVLRFSDDGKSYKAESYFRSGSQNYTANTITKDEIISYVMGEYKSHVARNSRRR